MKTKGTTLTVPYIHTRTHTWTHVLNMNICLCVKFELQ